MLDDLIWDRGQLAVASWCSSCYFCFLKWAFFWHCGVIAKCNCQTFTAPEGDALPVEPGWAAGTDSY